MTQAHHNSEYDKLRAIGIVLVVLGHTLGISRGVELYVYSFHMPLFFFISGLVLTPTRLKQSWACAAWHYAQRLLIPYFLFSIITYIPWVLVTRHYGADAALGIDAWQPLIGTFYGIGVGGWLQHNAMLWFFPCLFLLHFVFRVVHEQVRAGILQYVAIMALAYLGNLLPTLLPMRLPWGFEIALVALPFYAIGHILSLHKDLFPRAGKKAMLVMLLFFAFQYTCIEANGRVDMNSISLANPLLFYLGALSGIGALTSLVAFLPSFELFARLAEASVLAFTLHRTLFSVFSAFGLFLIHDLQAFKLSIWGSASYTVGALMLSVILLPLVRRYFPILIGGR